MHLCFSDQFFPYMASEMSLEFEMGGVLLADGTAN